MKKRTCFTVKGKPFYSIGIQAHNSSSSTREHLKYIWNAAKMLEANTAAVPVPWEKFEPQEGVFQDGFVREIICQARAQDLRLVLLWFGTWKNGTMEYTPAWVKRDWERFPRAELKGGKKTHNLSPHSPSNLEADQKAFCRLMEVLRDFDGEENTVIAVQIENEAGLLSATGRDFSPLGEAVYKQDVPGELLAYCQRHEDCMLAETWRSRGGKSTGNWREVFGGKGAEWLTTWAVASYIDRIAQAGREIYDIFLYTNAWISQGRGIPGVDWPAGTSLPENLDIYYAVCRHLDTIAPDIYLPEVTEYRKALETYARPEQGFPLYVPESARTWFNSGEMFEGVGEFGAIGYHVFGGESLLVDSQDALTEEGESMMHSFHMLRSLEAVLPRYMGTDRLHAIHRRGEELSALICGLEGGWRAYISFQGTIDQYYRMDFAHKEACLEEIAKNPGEPCRGLLLQESRQVFYVVGHKFRIFFLREPEADGYVDAMTAASATCPTNAEYLSVTEGHFEADGTYTADVCRTGDEARHGVYAQWDSNVLRIELLEIE